MSTKRDRPEVSEWDREYMRRLGRYKAEANADTLRLHLRRPPLERLEDSLRMSREYQTPTSIERHLAEDNPGAFYDRARHLGFIDS